MIECLCLYDNHQLSLRATLHFEQEFIHIFAELAPGFCAHVSRARQGPETAIVLRRGVAKQAICNVGARQQDASALGLGGTCCAPLSLSDSVKSAIPFLTRGVLPPAAVAGGLCKAQDHGAYLLWQQGCVARDGSLDRAGGKICLLISLSGHGVAPTHPLVRLFCIPDFCAARIEASLSSSLHCQGAQGDRLDGSLAGRDCLQPSPP